MTKKPICKACKGTGVYVGLGFHPTQPCDSCGGSGEEAEWPDEEKIEDDWRDDGEEGSSPHIHKMVVHQDLRGTDPRGITEAFYEAVERSIKKRDKNK